MTQTRLLEIFDEEVAKARALLEAKNADYARTGDALFNLRRAGPYGVAVRLDDKASRLIVLSEPGAPAPRNESIADTLLDMINYAVLYRALMEDGVASLLVPMVPR